MVGNERSWLVKRRRWWSIGRIASWRSIFRRRRQIVVVRRWQVVVVRRWIVLVSIVRRRQVLRSRCGWRQVAVARRGAVAVAPTIVA